MKGISPYYYYDQLMFFFIIKSSEWDLSRGVRRFSALPRLTAKSFTKVIDPSFKIYSPSSLDQNHKLYGNGPH